jgi:hypothetical protein
MYRRCFTHFAIPDTDSMPISGALCICGSLCGFLQMEVLSLSIFNQSGITIIQLQRYSGNGIWVIEWLSNGTGHRFLASYACYFNQEIPYFLLPKPHPFIFPKKSYHGQSQNHILLSKLALTTCALARAMHHRNGTRSWKKWVEKSSSSWSTCRRKVLSRNQNHNASQIDATESPRMDTTNAEFNRVLGGGLVPGVTLLGGEPGGLLQLCQTHHLKHMFLARSTNQNARRAHQKDVDNCYILTETKRKIYFRKSAAGAHH